MITHSTRTSRQQTTPEERVILRTDGSNVEPARETLLALLAIAVGAALTYASVELPRVANTVLFQLFDFPAGDPAYEPQQLDDFITGNHVRLVGYVALSVIAALVITGLLTERRRLATAGAVGIFLPVFGHFCRSMFFLAGLGVLRTFWMPVTDISVDLLRLGDVVYIPYMILVYPLALVGLDVRPVVPYVIMGAGMTLFVLGTMAWFVSQLQAQRTADFWIYRLSRHPQYLGWIVWSYGLMIYFARHNEGTLFKLSWSFADSLPFLVTTLIIIGVALVEEIVMTRHDRDSYEDYRARAPFMFPLPLWMAHIISAPMRAALGKQRAGTGGEVAVVLLVYAVLLILLSIPFVVFVWPPAGGWWGYPYNVFPFA